MNRTKRYEKTEKVATNIWMVDEFVLLKETICVYKAVGGKREQSKVQEETEMVLDMSSDYMCIHDVFFIIKVFGEDFSQSGDIRSYTIGVSRLQQS